jgi:hypothetical protein
MTRLSNPLTPQTSGAELTAEYAAGAQGAQVTGEHMKRSRTAILLLASAITLTTVSTHAQGVGDGHKHQQKTDKTDSQKPKADDKAYNAALKSLPDKPYDPWQGAR